MSFVPNRNVIRSPSYVFIGHSYRIVSLRRSGMDCWVAPTTGTYTYKLVLLLVELFGGGLNHFKQLDHDNKMIQVFCTKIIQV